VDCVALDLSYWDYVKESLQPALDIDGNKYTLDSIKSALDAQEMQLWCIKTDVIKAVFVTRVCLFPNAKVLECICLAGQEPQKWISVLLTTMEDFGKKNGCNLMETGGRMGWHKMFKNNGWDNFHIKMSKGI
jgi:hypothetical protein